MYDIITTSTIIFSIIFFVIMYQFAKDLIGDFKQMKQEERYFKTIESSLIKWNGGEK